MPRSSLTLSLTLQQSGHNWVEMRQSVQNHIRGLNFNYRVNLREKDVTYKNALGKFVDAHTLEVTDKKGKVSTITSSRFVIATGGRPTPINCEGGDLAISSDDLFSLEEVRALRDIVSVWAVDSFF